MGRIRMDDLDKYSSGGGNASYFQLKDDKDVARVRILLDKPEDIEDFIYGVHEVMVPGSQYPRDVNCLREYNEPYEKCPFCAAQMQVKPKLYIPLYNEDAEEVQIFTRGKGFISKLSRFLSRYKDPSVVAHSVEIERNGKKGDQKTSYELYETGCDDTTLEDLPEIPDIVGTMIMDKNKDEMEYYLDNKEFPNNSSVADDEEPPRRRRRQEEPEEEVPFEEDETPRSRERRTPSSRSNGRNSGRRNSF